MNIGKESEKIELHEEKYFIGDIIYELSDYVKSSINSSNVKFLIDVDENIPMGLIGDKEKIYKMLFNILNNSVKYTISGEIKFKVESKVSKGYANLEFTISDTGIGIKEEDFDKIFEKFAKLETDTKGIDRGAGLGLAITNYLVNMMNGKISFSSKYNIGTTFTINIKNKIIDYHKCGDIISHREALKAKATKIAGFGKRVMVVDDNKLNLKVIYNLLREYDIEVVLLESGNSCIELIKKREHFDLIIIDQLMPIINGIDTIKCIKNLDGYDIPPIIVSTANMTKKLKETLINNGVDGYISKPIDSKKIQNLLDYYFKK